MAVYDNIDALLKQRKMSRRRLARLAGIKETTLAACFARRPEHFPLKYGGAIAEVLDVSVDALYGSPFQTMAKKEEIPIDPESLNALPTYFHTVNPKQQGLSVGSISKEDQREQMLLEMFDMLNPLGQSELVKRAYEMTQISDYTRKEYNK